MFVYRLEKRWEILRQIDLQKMSIVAIKKIIFSDEAHFDLGGYVNKQNCRIWGTENSHAHIEKPTHPKRVTVWCGFGSKGIIWQFFFENEQAEAVTVNGDHYRVMLNKFLFTKIEHLLVSTGRRYEPHTQPKLHSIFGALFLKITLSAAELISFDHLGAEV